MTYREADDDLVRVVRAVAVQTALLSAAVHLLWAVQRVGDVGDVRPYLFLLSGSFLVLVAAAVFRGAHYRRLYALGAGVLAAQLVGYALWHGLGAVPTALQADPFAIVAKLAEAVGIVAFGALFRLAPPTSVVAERRSGAFKESILGDLVDEDRSAADEMDEESTDGKSAEER